MRIAIDCFKQIRGAGKSIGIYNVALNLVQNLAKEKRETANEVIANSEIFVFGNEANKEDFNVDGVNFVSVNGYDPTNKLHCIIWELFGVSKMCKRIKADRVLFPRGYCALTHPVFDIVLIHDLIPFYYNENFPNAFNKLENAYIMNRLKVSARGAKRIITISEASKADIIKHCGAIEDKVVVIHNACDVVDFHEKKVTISPEYLCSITSSLPHKNANGLLKSYVRYYKESEDPLDLVVIGIDSVSSYDVPKEIGKHIVCYKYIKDNFEMYRIISNSKIFIFLSLIEGFGLPPIEAMQLNVPVICSNRSSLPEVVGDAAILVDPTDDNAVSKAIIRLQRDKKLREDMIQKGKNNIVRFSWGTRAKLYWEAILRR